MNNKKKEPIRGITESSYYPWCLTSKEVQDIYHGNVDMVNAKKTLILSMEKDIEELRKCIETIKKL